MSARPSIFCLEGQWTANLSDATSVRPYLQLLADMRYADKLVHRSVATRAEFEHYASIWPQKKYSRFAIGYLAFHGDPQCIHIGRDQVTLSELAELLQGRLGGRLVVFGSCGTLVAPDAALMEFCKVTGAKAIFGYTKYIDWIESASFDLLLLRSLAEALKDDRYVKPIYNRMAKDHPQFVHGLGFRMAMQGWASPAKIARQAYGA